MPTASAALPLRQKILAWHLCNAALAGRDIFYDQRYAHSLEMREVLEEIVPHAGAVDAGTLGEIVRYTKLFWINSGPFNNLTARKFVPALLAACVSRGGARGCRHRRTLPAAATANRSTICWAGSSRRSSIASFESVCTSKTPGPGRDILEASANNLHQGVRMADLEGFEERYALNSRLVRHGDELVEEVYRIGGRYGKRSPPSSRISRRRSHTQTSLRPRRSPRW